MQWKWVAIPLLAALLAVAVIKPILSGSPGLHRTDAGTVMSSGEPADVTDANLVDVLTSLKLNLKIDRVDLKGQSLAVDLKIGSSQAGLKPIYEDLAELASLTVSGSANIDQLRFRLIAEDSWTGSRHLLLAADVRRDTLSQDFDGTIRQLLSAGAGPLAPEVKERLGIIETVLWRKSYPAASS